MAFRETEKALDDCSLLQSSSSSSLVSSPPLSPPTPPQSFLSFSPSCHFLSIYHFLSLTLRLSPSISFNSLSFPLRPPHPLFFCFLVPLLHLLPPSSPPLFPLFYPIIFLLPLSFLPPFPLPSSVLISLRYPPIPPPHSFILFSLSLPSATQPQDKWTNALLVIYSLLPPPPSSSAWGRGGLQRHK